eukprot:TRINITY_DN23114_c0_g1_i3.p1 TRINITY_DN23114_c0_g1~~TRINITY_DN23114_c0_g1_i3.p1  ORF type:complete len:212 (+),score=-24.35 TRINITY_DN23114_c0_g1_i3:630-1265(+)
MPYIHERQFLDSSLELKYKTQYSFFNTYTSNELTKNNIPSASYKYIIYICYIYTYILYQYIIYQYFIQVQCYQSLRTTHKREITNKCHIFYRFQAKTQNNNLQISSLLGKFFEGVKKKNQQFQSQSNPNMDYSFHTKQFRPQTFSVPIIFTIKYLTTAKQHTWDNTRISTSSKIQFLKTCPFKESEQFFHAKSKNISKNIYIYMYKNQNSL